MTKKEIIDEWYYTAYNDYLNGIITYDLWEEIKYTIAEWKAANIDYNNTKK